MDGAVILLAATPVPILLYYIAMFLDERRLSDLFGVISAVWAILATFLVLGGLPGILFFPVMFGTSALGGFLEYGRSKRKWELVQGLALVGVMIIVIVLLEAI